MDRDEFGERVREYERLMYSVAFAVLRNETDACDAMGDGILRAYSRLNELRDVTVFKTWILRIVHNTAVDMIRKRHDTVCLEEAAQIPMHDCENAEEKLVLREAVNRLKLPYRTAVTLFYYEDLPTESIARIMSVPTVTVRQYLYRARKQLKEMLSEEDFHR
ncbi:MAG: sigma-70 family RNA polymerase sigma factor [Clostridia bacterium]|nr:sigma-70 family RNA polymerase sigma factor [Clostridia bacterium]